LPAIALSRDFLRHSGIDTAPSSAPSDVPPNDQISAA
jgi:hypothetical protein